MSKELTESDVATYVVTYRADDRYQGFRAAYVTADDYLPGMLAFKNHLHQAIALVSAADVLTVERVESDPAADNPPAGTGFWPCGCPVDGAKAARMFAPGSCPHGFPPTVRCHQCSPVISPAAQADADAAYVRRGTVGPSEIRDMRDGLGDDGDTAGARL